MNKDEFHRQSVERPGILEALERDAAKIAGDPRRVLLCFTTDPYQVGGNHLTTRQAIKILHRHDLGVEILTKGGGAVLDFDLLGPKDRVGATLTFSNFEDSVIVEPHAAVWQRRIGMLRMAKNAGLQTFASMEPVIRPEQTLALIEMTSPFVDFFKVGKWNHSAEANRIDWKRFGVNAVELLERLGKKYLIKADLASEIGNYYD
jgi:DNA repair photolyase